MELMAGFEPATSSLPIIFHRFTTCYIVLRFVFFLLYMRLNHLNIIAVSLHIVLCAFMPYRCAFLCALLHAVVLGLLGPVKRHVARFESRATGLFILGLQGVSDRLTGPADAFFVGMGVHPERDCGITVTEALTDTGHICSVGDGD